MGKGQTQETVTHVIPYSAGKEGTGYSRHTPTTGVYAAESAFMFVMIIRNTKVNQAHIECHLATECTEGVHISLEIFNR